MASLSCLSAQGGLYAGGAGDGHAMGELVLKQVGVAELQQQLTVYPTILGGGQPVQITSSNSLDLQWRLLTLSGQQLLTGGFTGQATIPMQQVPAGAYILYVEGAVATATYKLNKVE